MIKKTVTAIAVCVSIIVVGVCSTLSHSLEMKDNKCGDCHQFIRNNIPADHPDVDEFEENVCVQIKIIFENINKGKFIAASHAGNDISCSSCHDDDMFEIGTEIDNETCFSCHESYEALAEQTKNIVVPEQNPHKSHLGEMDCTVCHHVHSRSRSYCLQCHSNFDMPIPGESVTSSHPIEVK